jgi:type I restriction enzyme S subunit
VKILDQAFYKMFGDPATNPMGWPISKIEEVASVRRGDFRHRPRTEPRFYGGPYPFIQINDITSSGIVIRHYTQTLNDDGLAISRMFPIGTVVLSIAATIAASGILGFDSCFPHSLVGVQGQTRRVRQEYLLFFFRLLAPRLASRAPQLAQKNLNLAILNDLNIPVPPLDLQDKFSRVVSSMISVSDALITSHNRVELLWNTVLHRAFSGELTARWREAHMPELLAEMEQQAKALASAHPDTAVESRARI